MLNEDMDIVDAASVSVTAADDKKEFILERLNKRNKERQNFLDVKLEQRNKENLQLEGRDYFAKIFAERIHDIEARIQNISEAAAKKSNGSDIATPTASELTRTFADIMMEIQEVQRYLTASTMYLSDFKIKHCQNVLNELHTICEDTRLRLMPKKKFGFSGKKVTNKAAINPKVPSISAADKLDASEKLDKQQASNLAAFTWTLANRKNEYIYLQHAEVNDKDITISNLYNCFVELQGHAGSVQISNAKNCTFLCGPIARSLFAENCADSTLVVACQQLRLHSSTVCRLFLHVTCRAIIEDCHKIDVACYDYDYATIDADFQQAGLDRTQNNYTDIADFNWLSPDMPSPNWQLLKTDCSASSASNWRDLRSKFQACLVSDQTNL